MHFDLAAYYDAATGRYAQPGFSSSGGLNSYTFMGGNPLGTASAYGGYGFAAAQATGGLQAMSAGVGTLPWPGALPGAGEGGAAAAGSRGLGVLGPIGVIIGGMWPTTMGDGTLPDDRRKRGRDDPISGEQPYNPGKDCNGQCKPCKDTVCWSASHKGVPQWHWIEWNQDPVTCQCFPKRGEGTSPPAGCKRIR